jgi:TonB family protein
VVRTLVSAAPRLLSALFHMIQIKRITKPAFAFLFIPLLAQGQDPADLLQQARALLASGHGRVANKVIPLLLKANASWEQSSSQDPRYAESLDLLAIMLRSNERNLDAWRLEAAPLVAHALEILDAKSDYQMSGDLALALELQADVLGHENPAASAGSPFWNRAFNIRAQLVAGMEQSARSSANPSSAPDPASPLYKVGAGVSPPSVTMKIDPEYSEFARLVRQSGTVTLAIVVDADGVPRNLSLVRSLGYGLDEKAAQAVLRWRFQPGIKDDKPVRVRATIQVNFKLL